MNLDITNLPNDINQLKTMVFNLTETNSDLTQVYKEKKEIINNLNKEKKEYKSKIDILEEQLKLLKIQLFGSKSEKYSPEAFGQMRLFNELEQELGSGNKDVQKITIAEHTRRKKGRRPLPAILPREEIIHELSEDERIHSCGRMMKEIGEDVTERIKIIPQKIIVEKHIRKKYGCECEGVDTEGIEGAIRIAPLPPQLILQSISTPSLLSYILIGKFADALPFYRQEKIFKRIGIDIPRQTMCYWAMKVYEKCKPMLELMKQEIQRGPLIGMDETPIQVLSEGDRKNQTMSYMWVCLGSSNDKPLLMYNYFPTRSAEFVKDYLKDYQGYLQCDGYPAYEIVNGQKGITIAGCWAHARRKFVDVVKVSENKNNADTALEYIRKLYLIEKKAKRSELSADKIKELRQRKSKPILEEFKKWLDQKTVEVPPKTTLGKAIGYTQNEWKKLMVYLEDGRIPIDNNFVENAIRPFVLGRKNWLFAGSPRGANASAGLYSLIETAKANGLEPFWYLLYLFENIPTAKTDADYLNLLPCNVDKSSLKSPFP